MLAMIRQGCMHFRFKDNLTNRAAGRHGVHLVLWNICPRGHSNLHQEHLVAPLWVLLQELLKGQQLLRECP